MSDPKDEELRDVALVLREADAMAARSDATGAPVHTPAEVEAFARSRARALGVRVVEDEDPVTVLDRRVRVDLERCLAVTEGRAARTEVEPEVRREVAALVAVLVQLYASEGTFVRRPLPGGWKRGVTGSLNAGRVQLDFYVGQDLTMAKVLASVAVARAWMESVAAEGRNARPRIEGPRDRDPG